MTRTKKRRLQIQVKTSQMSWDHLQTSSYPIIPLHHLEHKAGSHMVALTKQEAWKIGDRKWVWFLISLLLSAVKLVVAVLFLLLLDLLSEPCYVISLYWKDDSISSRNIRWAYLSVYCFRFGLSGPTVWAPSLVPGAEPPVSVRQYLCVRGQAPTQCKQQYRKVIIIFYCLELH